MSEAWKNLDLEGGGLQAANVQLARLQKKPRIAFILLAFFPLGLHRIYLNDRRGLGGYLALTLIAIVLGYAAPLWTIALPLTLSALWALTDIRWIEDQITRLNKQLRMQIFFKQSGGAPKGYKGRYVDEALELDSYIKQKESERGGHQPFDKSPASPASGSRVLSFNQQEAMLREMAKRKKEEDAAGKSGSGAD